MTNYAKNKEYVEKYVTEPTQYIVIDHDQINKVLLNWGIDSVVYWNVIGLTPSVYRGREENSNWVVKRELSMFYHKNIKEHAEYVLIETINIMLAIHQKKNSIKLLNRNSINFKVKDVLIPLYTKADTSSTVKNHIPVDVTEVQAVYSVSDLNGNMFYCVENWNGKGDWEEKIGFISAEYVIDE